MRFKSTIQLILIIYMYVQYADLMLWIKVKSFESVKLNVQLNMHVLVFKLKLVKCT